MSTKNILSLFVFLFLFSITCTSQIQTGKPNQRKHSKDSISIKLDSSFIADFGKSALERYVDKFADSLNNLKKTHVFPVFLLDAQFDYTHSGFAPSHHPYPLRQMIISKVKDCQSLRMLLNSKNKEYVVRPTKEYGIDVNYSNLSFYELAAKRYEEMNCGVMY
jgi:hypothetical protein